MLTFLVLISTILILSCTIGETGKPKGTLSVSELLQNPVYDTEVKVYGKVSLLDRIISETNELGWGSLVIFKLFAFRGSVL